MATAAEIVISVDGLHKRYGSKRAVDGVSFEVRRGEIFGVLGPNGAGKTTTVEIVAGLRVADTGIVRVLGLDPQADRDRLRQLVGVQLQESELHPKMTVAEALEMFSAFYPHPADGQALARELGLGEKLSTQYRHLSGGQKQRLAIALALIGNPELAVLDELTTGLDPQARREVWELIEGVRNSGVTIVLVTHFMDEAERLCDRIAVIDRGKVVAIDTPAGLIARSRDGNLLRFRTSEPVALERLRAILEPLPSVEGVELVGEEVLVRGKPDAVVDVLRTLGENSIGAVDVAVERSNLEDAFVDLTSHGAETKGLTCLPPHS